MTDIAQLIARGELPDDWYDYDAHRAIFLAALTGITANPAFFGAIHQGEPRSAVKFAKDVLIAALQAQQETSDAD